MKAADGIKPPQVEVDIKSTASTVSISADDADLPVEEKANEIILPQRDCLDDVNDALQGVLPNTTPGPSLNVNPRGEPRAKRGRTESPTESQTTLHVKSSKPAGKNQN